MMDDSTNESWREELIDNIFVREGKPTSWVESEYALDSLLNYLENHSDDQKRELGRMLRNGY